MVILKIKDFVPVDGLIHIATTWEIASDEAFTSMLVSERSDTMLDMFYSEIIIPFNIPNYVRAKRHFNNATADYYTDGIEVLNNTESYSEMLLTSDVTIDTPIVTVSKEEILSESDTFNISTTKYRGENDQHAYTHWIIKDGLDKIVYINLYDTNNKTSIDIDKNINIASRTILKFIVIHGTASGIESKPGTKTLFVSNVNFEVTSDLSKVTPLKDYILTMQRVNPNITARVNRVIILDSNQETELFSKYLTTDELTVTIPWTVFRHDATFYIDVYGYDLNNNATVLRKILTTQSNKFTTIIDSEYVYKDVFIKTEISGLTASDYVSTSAALAGEIPIPLSTSINTFVCMADDGTLVQTPDTFQGLDLITTNNQFTYIHHMANNMVLVDTLDNSNLPIFLLFKHDPYKNTYTLIKSKVRDDETTPCGKNGSILQISLNKFLYVPYNGDSIREYDILTNTVTILGIIPNNSLFKGVMIPMNKNQVLLYGGDNFEANLFNYGDGEFKNSTSVIPDSYLNRDLKVVQLTNGDSLIFKTKYISGDNDCVKYFDYNTSMFKDTNLTFTPHVYPNTTIRTNSGDVHLAYYDKDNVYTVAPNSCVLYTIN